MLVLLLYVKGVGRSERSGIRLRGDAYREY